MDYVPAYSPPVISGPNPANLNQSNYYTFTPVGAATGYDWQQTQLAPYTAVEGAENGLAFVTVVSSAGYSVLASDVKASGAYSFHLCHPAPPSDQFISLNSLLRLGANAQLTFSKRLGYAGAAQVAKAQISTDGGATWQDVWTQSGSGGAGESSFSTVNLPLGAFAGQFVRVRFAYTISSGSYYSQTSSGVGFYLDDISFSDADQVISQVAHSVPLGTSFTFSPTNSDSTLLQVRARINTRTMPWGPASAITVVVPSPAIQLTGKPVVTASQAQLDFDVANYRAGMTFELWTNSNPASIFARDTTATFQTLVANSRFRASVSTAGAVRRFYRVKGVY